MRKTKIICTLGPSSTTVEQIETMVKAGMNVARVNMSHGTYQEHLERINNVKTVREKLGVSLPVMIDTKGPEVRICNFKEGKISVKKGHVLQFVNYDILGDETKVAVTYANLYKDVEVGGRLLLNDGLLCFEITEIQNDGTICAVALNDGVLSNHKSLFAPGAKLNMPFLSEQDMKDLAFGVKAGAELVAASFVQDGKSVRELREYLATCGGEHMMIISKIESQSGVDNLDEIIALSDGIMVARGDLGVELPYEKLPALQKKIITKSRRAGKFVITATEMLESMVNNLRPTRAEIADVANAVFDGTSCVMLSAESAVGINPANTVTTMSKIALEAENNIFYREKFVNEPFEMLNTTDAVSHAVANTSFDVGAKAIVVFTHSGRSARMVSRFRAECPIIALTRHDNVFHQLATSWAVTPGKCDRFENTDDMFDYASKISQQLGFAQKGDNIIITAGIPLGKSPHINVIKVETIK